MRVLHVYRTFFPDTQGGLEEVIRQICNGTTALGAQNTVFTTTKDPNAERHLEISGTTVVRVPETFEIASCNVALRSRAEFSKQVEETDIIHYHFPWPFADVLDRLTKPNKPSLVTYHSDIVRQKLLLRLYTPLMKRFLEAQDRIVCTSPNYFATSSTLSPLESKVDIIPIGLDRSIYPQITPELLNKMKAEYGSQFFLFVGVLRYYKGLHILLEAIKNAPYKVVIVGSGPTEKQLKEQAESLQLTNVVFAGHVSDEEKVALFELSRGIVFPSYLRSEAFGVTLLEGAMHSKPLISTEVGSGTSHVNVHEKTGLVVAPGSPSALRRAMDQLYDRPDMAKLMGQRARERFDMLFTGQLMARRYFELYQSLLGKTESSKEERPAKSA